MPSVAHRVALITGAGGGLGRCHALALADQGTRVVVNDLGSSLEGVRIPSKEAQETVDLIVAAGGHAVVSEHDVSTHDGARAAVQRAIDAFGKLDVVVNNAGILRDRTFAKMDLDDFDAVVRVHLGSSAYVTHAAWPHLSESGSGRVVFTSSASGLYGGFGQANYAAAKSAMVGLMNVLKQEGAAKGIKVNTIAPVATTRMTEELLPPAALQRLSPAAVSPVVAYLCSVDCDVTGEIIETGGGLIARVQVVESETAEIGTSATPQDVEVALAKLSGSTGVGYASSSDALARIIEHAARM